MSIEAEYMRRQTVGVECQLLGLRARLEGMIAFNANHEEKYTQQSFDDLADQADGLTNQLHSQI